MMLNIDEQRPLLNNLVHAVLNHYPIGSSIPNEQYNGYKVLTNKIEEKINCSIDGKLPTSCNLLMDEINKTFVNYSIHMEFDKQFPNYSLSIELFNKSFSEVDIVYKLKLRVSLIVKHFTIFHEEVSYHKNSSSKLSRFEPVRIPIISSTSLIADINNDWFKLLRNLVEKYFPDYSFIGHNLLFANMVKNGTPHGLEGFSPESEYPLYAFLFDNEFGDMKNVYVAY